MRKPDFTEVIEIVAKADKSLSRFQWDLGDALIRVCGRPNPYTRNDASFSKLEDCSAELLKHGYEYEANSLRMFRYVANSFPHDMRISGVSWGAHLHAGDPNTLNAIIEAAPRNKKITQAYVKESVRALALARQRELDTESVRRREALEEARREREKAERERDAAQTERERRAAADRAADARKREVANKMPPKLKDIPKLKPQAADMPILVARASFNSDLNQIERLVAKLDETYAEFISVFPEADLENGHERLMTIAEMARTLADKFRKGNGKGKHLSVVTTTHGN